MRDFGEVRWIGGGSGAGKTTVAEHLRRRFGAPVLSTDDSLRAHAAALPDAPLIAAFTRASMDQRWVLREPAEMLRTFPWFAGDGFDLLLAEVREGEGPLLVEGFRLLPRLVAPLLGPTGRAVFLLPTPEMRLRAFGGRDVARSFWTRTSDPDRALANLLERDRLFTERVREEATGLSLPTIEVDGAAPAHEVAARAAPLLALDTP